MNRRDLLKSLLAGGAAMSFPRLHAAPSDYGGRFFVCMQMEGAWDVSSFCDPKLNTPGEPEINTWARTGQVRTAGNIAYADWAGNRTFFDKYYRDILVINGIDAQTNAHSTGILHTWSGRNSAGYPSLPSLFAATYAPELPLGHVYFGGYAETGGIGRYTRLDDVESLRELTSPNTVPWEGSEVLTRHNPEVLERITAARLQRMDRMLADDSLLPRQRLAASAYRQALLSQSRLADLANYLPDASEIPQDEEVNDQITSNLRRQTLMTVLSFLSGTACSADLYLGGFDTHTTHNTLHEPLLRHATECIDALWEYAEEYGIADRLTVLIASDFSRTPFYNATQGKDHWPIGSAMVMERNASWTNRVVGLTDEVQNAFRINPQSLERDDNGGTIIYPKHLHKALRAHLGINGGPFDAAFPLNNVEDFGFFRV